MNRAPVLRAISTSGSITNVDDALRRCRDALATRPAALITDIDGTISRIVPRPEDATVLPGAASALARLLRSLDLVAVITGRDEATARRMVGVPGLTYVANYSLESGIGSANVRSLLPGLEPKLAEMPCVQVETKDTGFSLHYRNCPDPESVRARLLEIAMTVAETAAARVLEGKKVIEVVPAGLPGKAAALRRLVHDSNIRGLVYLGDDIADVDVFDEAGRLRREEGTAALAIAVIDRESHPALAAGADIALGSVDDVGALLAALAAAMEGSGTRSEE